MEWIEMTNRIELLQTAFEGLSVEAAQEIISHLRENTYPAGTVLCQEGALENTFYLIVEGQVEITKWLEFAQEERFLRHSEDGDFFGEMALINDAPRAATVRTTRQSTVLEMNRDSFLKIISASPTMALAMVRTTLSRMRSNDQMQLAELQKTYQSLQELDRAKLDFIEVAAHELRTPLTVVQGYAKLVELSVADSNLEEATQGILEGISRMLQVVNAMLDVSKIDNQTLKVSPVPVLTKMLCTEAIQAFKKALQERQITIQEQYTPNIPFIYADPILMSKLFYQLVSNAIKYTPDGGTIKITSEEITDSRVGQGIYLKITDSGVGIDNQHMQRIFEKFFQGGNVSLHSSSKTAFMGGGPGLGLAIASGIVRAHQGEIWAESEGYDPENPRGTTFHILLPIGSPS